MDGRFLGVFRGFLLRFWGIGHHGASVAWLGLGRQRTNVLAYLDLWYRAVAGLARGWWQVMDGMYRIGVFEWWMVVDGGKGKKHTVDK